MKKYDKSFEKPQRKPLWFNKKANASKKMVYNSRKRHATQFNDKKVKGTKYFKPKYVKKFKNSFKPEQQDRSKLAHPFPSQENRQQPRFYKKGRKFGLKKVPKWLPTDQVRVLNRVYRLKFWLNRSIFEINAMPLDLYVSIRRTLMRRQNLVTAYSPYFLKFFKWKSLKTFCSTTPRLENLKNFKFFGYRLSLYALFKKRWKHRPYSYKYRCRVLLNFLKPGLIKYAKNNLKNSSMIKSHLNQFAESRQFFKLIKMRFKKFLKPLRRENLLNSAYSAFDFDKFWKSNHKLSHPKAMQLFDYFMNPNGSRIRYDIFREPVLYRLRRECRKYKFLALQLRTDAYRKLVEQLRSVIPTVVVQPSLNNLIVYVYKRKQLIFSLSAGMTLRYKGESRQTNAAKFNLLDYACTKLEHLGIKAVDLKILDNSKRRTLKFYKSFLYKKKFKIRRIICAKRTAHNGIRLRKARRI